MSELETPSTRDQNLQPSVPARKPWNAPKIEEIDHTETAAWPVSSRFLDMDVLTNTY